MHLESILRGPTRSRFCFIIHHGKHLKWDSGFRLVCKLSRGSVLEGSMCKLPSEQSKADCEGKEVPECAGVKQSQLRWIKTNTP